MTFNDAEVAYLKTQRLGRLATVTPSQQPNQVPVGFRLNPDHTIDIGGPMRMLGGIGTSGRTRT
ncbi:pyridoxamine 5'-phosphate oxidase family protein [Nocardia wallacei]|uniref:pyridoxamine 5'-phosphate oxidase family protein n=1 Tax=Nocardia wallacei TaxID=480035 RepID=UPI00245491B3|nr:pyridoxamine 5'-phosphate oxidase family protein [Nocardia wallacei]